MHWKVSRRTKDGWEILCPDTSEVVRYENSLSKAQAVVRDYYASHPELNRRRKFKGVSEIFSNFIGDATQ